MGYCFLYLGKGTEYSLHHETLKNKHADHVVFVKSYVELDALLYPVGVSYNIGTS